MGTINGDYDSPNTFTSKKVKNASPAMKPFFVQLLEKKKIAKRK